MMRRIMILVQFMIMVAMNHPEVEDLEVGDMAEDVVVDRRYRLQDLSTAVETILLEDHHIPAVVMEVVEVAHHHTQWVGEDTWMADQLIPLRLEIYTSIYSKKHNNNF